MLNFIPFGIKFQTNSKQIIPYGYLGVGGAKLMTSDHIIKNYENFGNKKNNIFTYNKYWFRFKNKGQNKFHYNRNNTHNEWCVF